MSNPLLTAAANQGAPVRAPSSTVSTPQLVPYASSEARVRELEAQVAQLTQERDGNRELVADAASLRMQRNVLLLGAGVLAVMWWRAR